jgi:hypothetical protein
MTSSFRFKNAYVGYHIDNEDVDGDVDVDMDVDAMQMC